MTARKMVRKAELDSVLASLKKVGMDARIEIEPGRITLVTGRAATAPSTNPLDDMFG